MDHMIPDMDGMEATAAIRAMAGRENMPIIALTANAVSGMKELFLQNGFSDFLSKPIAVRSLDAMLKKWIPLEKQQPNGRNAPAAPVAPVAQADLVDGLDVEKGIHNVGGRKSVYANVLTVFRQDCAIQARELLSALDDGDYPACTIAAHALKGSLRTIGAGKLAVSAMRLENAASKEDAAFLQENTRPFLDDLRALTDAFDRVLPGLTAREEDGDGKDFAGTEELSEKLEPLRRALLSMDVRAVNELLAECLSMELLPGERVLIDEVDMLVMDFEFEKAVARIREFSVAFAQKG
jgi:CheY-like chemotaxis protein